MRRKNGRKKPAFSAGLFLAYPWDLVLVGLFLNCANRACSNTGQAADADLLIALRLSIIIERKCSYRADTYAGTAADAVILINLYGHDMFLLGVNCTILPKQVQWSSAIRSCRNHSFDPCICRHISSFRARLFLLFPLPASAALSAPAVSRH